MGGLVWPCSDSIPRPTPHGGPSVQVFGRTEHLSIARMNAFLKTIFLSPLEVNVYPFII